jgi:hypothetical protein
LAERRHTIEALCEARTPCNPPPKEPWLCSPPPASELSPSRLFLCCRTASEVNRLRISFLSRPHPSNQACNLSIIIRWIWANHQFQNHLFPFLNHRVYLPQTPDVVQPLPPVPRRILLHFLARKPKRQGLNRGMREEARGR